jgi:hypothetical protein
MTPEFAAKLATKLSDYRHWALGRHFNSVRLVQYCGVEMVGARDIALSEVEQQISGCTCEGFGVEWAEQNQRLYLCVWEPWDQPGTAPDWSKVFIESSDLVDDRF